VATKAEKLKQFDLVLVKWNDAHNLASAWTALEDIKDLKTDCVIETVGRFLKIAGKQVVLCADMSIEDDNAVILNTLFSIPLACIEQVDILRSANATS
jgi:hypothetical protein